MVRPVAAGSEAAVSGEVPAIYVDQGTGITIYAETGEMTDMGHVGGEGDLWPDVLAALAHPDHAPEHGFKVVYATADGTQSLVAPRPHGKTCPATAVQP